MGSHMHARIALAAALALAIPADAWQVTGPTMTLTQREVSYCKREGGCYVVSHAALQMQLQAAQARGAASAQCKGQQAI